MEKMLLQVKGMKCSVCESSMKRSLEAVDGVNEVRADHKNNQVEVDFDASMMSLDRVKEAITKQGFVVNG